MAARRRGGRLVAMASVVRTVSWVLVFVALGVVGAAWFTPRPDLDAGQAADAAVGALASVGFDATVTKPVTRTTHDTADGQQVAVWDVFADVDGEEIETQVRVDEGQLVYLDDRIGADRSDRLLSDDQFAAIADYRDRVTLDDWIGRNVAASVAGALVALLAFVVAKRSDPLWRNP